MGCEFVTSKTLAFAVASALSACAAPHKPDAGPAPVPWLHIDHSGDHVAVAPAVEVRAVDAREFRHLHGDDSARAPTQAPRPLYTARPDLWHADEDETHRIVQQQLAQRQMLPLLFFRGGPVVAREDPKAELHALKEPHHPHAHADEVAIAPAAPLPQFVNNSAAVNQIDIAAASLLQGFYSPHHAATAAELHPLKKPHALHAHSDDGAPIASALPPGQQLFDLPPIAPRAATLLEVSDTPLVMRAPPTTA